MGFEYSIIIYNDFLWQLQITCDRSQGSIVLYLNTYHFMGFCVVTVFPTKFNILRTLLYFC